ncbi:MAG: CopG family antitoxin, partial [bacterium]
MMPTSEVTFMSKKDKRVDPIPDAFSSYEEAAEFWDTHDITDYPDSFQDVDVKAELRKRRSELEVDEDLMKALRTNAQKLGVPVSRLASDLLRRQMI